MGDNRNAFQIDLVTFSKRLTSLYSNWNDKNSDLWNDSDVLVIATPPPSEDLRYLKSSALIIWLLGYEFFDTIVVFTRKHIHFLCSQKKASLLDVIKKAAKEAVGVDVLMHIKGKGEDGSSQMEVILRNVRSFGDDSVVGYLVKEAPEGKLLETWDEKLKNSGLKLCDITPSLSDLFAVKDAGELRNVNKAAFLSASVMKNFVVPKLEKVIDEEKKVSHSSLMKDTEKVILEPLKIKVKLKAENIDICYPPIFQSDGQFDLRASASSNDKPLCYESASVIICAVGSRYSSYCSNVARTFLIDANSLQSKAYAVLLKAHEAAIGALNPGNAVSAVYMAALAVVEREAPELVGNLTKNAGTGMGLEFRESGLILNAKNDRILRSGMVFNVSLGFQNLQAQTNNPKSQNFALLLADTVIVGEKGAEISTSLSTKAENDVSYSFNEDDEEELPKAKTEVNVKHSLPSKTTLRSDHAEINREEHRRQHQAELARQKNEETARRLAGGSAGSGDNRSSLRSSSELVAYKNVNDLPPRRDVMMIRVDQVNNAILLPVYGTMVPFHIATVKSITDQSDTNNNWYIRIIFNIPGTPFSSFDANTLRNQGAIYVKEVSFHSKDSNHVKEVVLQIRTLRRTFAARESERAERATLVTQEKLILLNRSKPIRLSDLWIRPVFGGRGRKQPGLLVTHSNGFRFSTSKPDERVDVMFANIKHAFFQPAENEQITLLHFHLHNHIMVGKKKTKDVQFYVEVMDVVQTLGGSRRSAYDPDEIEEEQRERNRKNKINMDFENFVTRVNELWGNAHRDLKLEFDMPIRDLGFHGVPYKSSAFIVPTSGCIVELIEPPFLVITMSEIEIVNLERVEFGHRSFDMTIVFKDFKRAVFRIDSIPQSSLESIKDWLDTTGIKYYENRTNLQWSNILKTITDDPESFIKGEGWEFLNMDAGGDSESDNSQESDQGYVPSDMEAESASEDEDSDSESLVGSDEDDEEEEDAESEEDKGKSWEELEREASNADRERGDEPDSEEDRRKKKIKAFGKSRAGPSSSSLPKRPKMR